MLHGYRFFQGKDTKQIAYTGQPALPFCWYYEPIDYKGYMLWSLPCSSQEEAEEEAREEQESDEHFDE